MLSRTAEGLFWLGRYMERADNLARLIEAGRRFDLTGAHIETESNEWAAILIAAGCSNTFEKDPEEATGAEACHHLILDPENPSSVQACFAAARANARAQRGSITTDVWAAANDAWADTRLFSERDYAPRNLASTVDQIRQYAARMRGAVEGTMLRDERYQFMRLGQFIERADATSRLVDVKYHVLMPEDHPVGSGVDQLHWNNLLLAAGARSAYRWVYREQVQVRLVIDFLLLNRRNPRSLRHCLDQIQAELGNLHGDGAHSNGSLTHASALREDMTRTDVDFILGQGLHEYLTEMIVRSNKLAISIGSDFGFGPILSETTQEQSQ
ncbi:alpha-E domain-containing protein [Chachezhania antarctica]|uniref:alpha-E domain-containing protein n=1 Tax=Chachezhania antarctica TaxID=2340860 RepID=UPI000EADCD3E|nr:alpha-E domain-containing protein [Chachezhania antarctica]|tara:strand:- start:5022 stop:6002 length:981 start_codon:yes stop_codon:yes gene_type:complete